MKIHFADWLENKRHRVLMVILSLMFFLLLREFGNENLGYPDADRILMDGVFLHDVLHDSPYTDIYGYTVRYFAQYPALSIGYRPPFFPFIEALFNTLFGVTMASGRLAIAAFMLFGAIAWYQLVYKLFDAATALCSVLLYVTTPFVIQWGWYTMSELPVLSVALMALYYFHRYTETAQANACYAAIILLSLAAWTKQTAIFLAVFFVLYAVFKGQLKQYLKRREVWLAIGLAILLLAPLAAITIVLGKKNIAQSLGHDASIKASFINWDAIFFYLRHLYGTQLNPVTFFLSLLGMVSALFYKEKRMGYFFVFILSTDLFFSYLTAKDPRYSIFWIPAFCLFAVLPFYYLQGHRKLQNTGYVLLLLLAAYQIVGCYEKKIFYATGYDAAAHYVLDNSKSPMVFFDGYNNGYFTYFSRVFDVDRQHFVLRGDKLLSSSSVFSNSEQAIHANNEKDFNKILTDYGSELLVIEKQNEIGIAIHDIFRNYLKTADFELIKTIPVNSNRNHIDHQELQVYRFLKYQPLTADHLELHLPIVGQILNIPLPK